MARPTVPQFGNWEECEDDVPYTVYFEKARKNKGGKNMNPNNPQESPDMFQAAKTKQVKVQPEEPVKRVAPKAERYRVVNEPSHQGYGGRNVGGGSARPSRPPSVGSEYSIDRSPLHPSQKSRLTGKGNGINNGSPAYGYEGKRTNDSSHGTPRSKTKTGDNSRDVAIPKFGDWESADNYTYIFNKNARGANAVDEDSIQPNNSHHTKNGDVKKKLTFIQRCLPFCRGKK